MMRLKDGAKGLVGRCCKVEVRALYPQKDIKHVGIGFQQGAPLTAEQIAKRTEMLRRGSRTAAQKRAALRSGLILEGLRPNPAWNRRWWELLLMVLSNFGTNGEIAAALGYCSAKHVEGLLRRPEFQKAIEDVRRAQLERIIAGEFGVKAQAKIAAKKVIPTLEGVLDAKESKNSDKISAGKVVLQVSGDLVETHRHHHVFELIKGLSKAEVDRLGETGEWPERLRPTVENLGLLPAPQNGR